MFDCTPTYNPHRGLWQEVLLQAVEDALLGPSQLHSWMSRLRVCEHARSYLTTPSADLAEVCENAGFDMAAVIEHLRLKIDKAPRPEELASQSRRQSAASICKRPKPKRQPKRVPFPDCPFTINGTTRTAAEWCARFGVPLALAQSRMGRSWAPERAFTMTSAEARAEALAIARQSPRLTISNDRKRRAPSASTPRYSHNGESLTLAQWADRVGLKKGTLAKRIRSGLTLAEALAPGNLHASRSDAENNAQQVCQHIGKRRVDDVDSDSFKDCPAHDGAPPETEESPSKKSVAIGFCAGALPGVVSNLRPSAGTGGVRSAHDFPDLSFSLVTSETPENDRHC